MDIQFYHLLSTPLEVALPKLEAMAYGKEMRTNIVADAGMLGLLDKALWTYNPNDFLPHGVEGEKDEEQSILLSQAPSKANQASLLMITNGLKLGGDDGYARVFDIFNGNDDVATQQARERWSAYKEKGYGLTYIKQRDNGGWDKVMEVNKGDAS